MRRKYAMYPGRWQNWHAGHEWLIRQQLDKGKNCWVAIRDVQVDDNNPKSAHQVLMDLSKEKFFIENSDKINGDVLKTLKDKLKKYRQSGLEKEGELSYENLVFKFLRRSGHIGDLFDALNKRLDKELSIETKIKESK